MSDIFDDTLIAAAESFFLLPGTEKVTYFPAAGGSRKIKAVISRIGADSIPGVEGGSLPGFTVLVRNNATAGIDSASVNTGGDKIECAKRVDERPKLLRITEIINHDVGLMLLAAS